MILNRLYRKKMRASKATSSDGAISKPMYHTSWKKLQLISSEGPQKQGADLEANSQGTDNYVGPLSSG